MSIPIAAWTLQGLINGERVDVAGSGEFDTTSGRMVLDLTSQAPLPAGFDLIPAQMICNVATTGFAASTSADGFSWASFSPAGVRITPDRIGRVHTAAGVEVLRLGQPDDHGGVVACCSGTTLLTLGSSGKTCTSSNPAPARAGCTERIPGRVANACSCWGSALTTTA